MILEIQLMLPKRNATRLKLRKPINPQLTAPIILIVSEKYCKNLFPISHHPFTFFSIAKKIKNMHGSKKTVVHKDYCNLIVCDVILPPPKANASEASNVTSDLSIREKA